MPRGGVRLSAAPRTASGEPAASPDVASSLQHFDRENILRWVMLLAAGAWAGYFLFTGMPQLTLHVFPRTLVLHALIGGTALAYLAYLAVARRLPGGTPLDF